MRNVIVGLIIGMSVSVSFAQGVITNPELMSITSLARHEMHLKQRIGRLEALMESQEKVSVNHGARLRELERKMAGVQRQITILHAEKMDKQ